MKKIISLLFVASFLFAGIASAQMMGGYYSGQGDAVVAGSQSIDVALQDIYASQKVTNQSGVDCAKVTDNQFEKLGDAVMGAGITEQQHAAMESMMGGEGSPTLTQAHINMGRSYISCWADYNGTPIPMMGYVYSSGSTTQANSPTTGDSDVGPQMMGAYGNGYAPRYGMMNNVYGGQWGMMDGYYPLHTWFGVITMILFWTLLVLAIIALVRWLRKTK